MARLNDPPVAPGPSSDTVDAVKRRFLRQNRELAKTNSQQSVRIRNLETEGARLLAENLSLREQVLHLQNALESQSSRPSFENIGTIKDSLEAKIHEFGKLVAELGQIQNRRAEPKCKPHTTATRRAPEERQWRSGLGLQEVQDAMLPTIAEGKYYPRKTMNEDELREILDDPESQSPDLGPPPVSRFENEDVDPIKYDPEGRQPEEAVEEEYEETNPAMSINLETRRKRRESNPKITIRRISVFQSPPNDSEEGAGKPLRAGAKRKLSAREEEEKQDGASPADRFRFSRVNAHAVSESEVANVDEPKRPVLGTKSINIDPVVSPKKQRASTLKDGKADPQKPGQTAKTTKTGRNRTVDVRPATIEIPHLPPEPIVSTDIHPDSLPPKTPAVEDIFSPQTSQPSTARPQSKDTPPPSDLNPSNPAEQAGTGGRPSRRARAQVNYAEPNLVSKMRRPGKELVDAVVPPTAPISATAEPAPPTVRKSIKKEKDEGSDSWKNLPTATGSGTQDDGEAQSPLRDKLGRRDQGQTTKSGTGSGAPTLNLNSSAAANAISALINGSSSRRKSTTPADPIDPSASSSDAVLSQSDPALGRSKSKKASSTSTSSSAAGDKALDNLAVFDLNDPPTTKSGTKTSRRHSTLPSMETQTVRGRDRENPAYAKLAAKEDARKARSGTREKSGLIKERENGTSKGGEKEGKESGSESAGTRRNERATSRRKSMMV